jgi:hypothetical protein
MGSTRGSSSSPSREKCAGRGPKELGSLAEIAGAFAMFGHGSVQDQIEQIERHNHSHDVHKCCANCQAHGANMRPIPQSRYPHGQGAPYSNCTDSTIFEMNVEIYRRRAALDRKRGPPTHATIKEKSWLTLSDQVGSSLSRRGSLPRPCSPPSGTRGRATWLPLAGPVDAVHDVGRRTSHERHRDGSRTRPRYP